MASASVENEKAAKQELVKTAARSQLEARDSKLQLVFFLGDTIFTFKKNNSADEMQLVSNKDICPPNYHPKKRKRTGDSPDGTTSAADRLLLEIRANAKPGQTLREYFVERSWKQLCRSRGLSSEEEESGEPLYGAEPDWSKAEFKREQKRYKNKLREIEEQRLAEK